MLLAARDTKPELPTSPGAMVLAPPASHRPQPYRSSGVARELAAVVPNSAAEPGAERSGPPTSGATHHHHDDVARAAQNRVPIHHDGSRDDPGANRSEPRTEHSGVSANVPAEVDPYSERRSRPFKVELIAPQFYEEAMVLVRDKHCSPIELYRLFLDRYGHISKSSFYRWCEVRFEEGIPPAPIAENQSAAGWQPTPHDILDIRPDPPEFQSCVILDLALRLPRTEIELLAGRLTQLRSAGNITLPESALLRAVRARQSYDLAMERDARFWVI